VHPPRCLKDIGQYPACHLLRAALLPDARAKRLLSLASPQRPSLAPSLYRFERILGTNHPSTAMSYHNIGIAYWSKGKYDKALEFYKKALAIRERVLGTYPRNWPKWDRTGGTSGRRVASSLRSPNPVIHGQPWMDCAQIVFVESYLSSWKTRPLRAPAALVTSAPGSPKEG